MLLLLVAVVALWLLLFADFLDVSHDKIQVAIYFKHLPLLIWRNRRKQSAETLN